MWKVLLLRNPSSQMSGMRTLQVLWSRLTTASSQIESTTLAVLVNTVSARSLAQVIACMTFLVDVSGSDDTLPLKHEKIED